MITAERLIDLKPNINKRNLPAKLRDTDGSGGGSNFAEREIIFKFLYEMKNDLSDLKSLVYELIRTNDLSVPDLNKIRQLSSTTGFMRSWITQRNCLIILTVSSLGSILC